MSGWNLPPGCTDADIDRAFGEDEPLTCDNCGTLNAADETECRNCGFRLKEPDPDDEYTARADYEYEHDR